MFQLERLQRIVGALPESDETSREIAGWVKGGYGIDIETPQKEEEIDPDTLEDDPDAHRFCDVLPCEECGGWFGK